MNFRTFFFCLIIITLIFGCAAREEETISTREPRNLITRDDYKDLQVKPPKEEPIEVDYSQGIIKQSITPIPKKPTQVVIQDKFLSVATYGSVDELRKRYENGGKVNFRNEAGETVLLKVLEGPYDDQTLLKFGFLLSVGAKVDFYGTSGEIKKTTPLNVAVLNSSPVFKSDTPSRSPLIAEYIINYLIDNGADLSAHDEYGRTPLHNAVLSDNVVAARLLLASGAPVMQQDHSGRTPLHLAQSHEIENILKEFGAVETEDPTLELGRGKAPTKSANGSEEIWKPLRDVKRF